MVQSGDSESKTSQELNRKQVPLEWNFLALRRRIGAPEGMAFLEEGEEVAALCIDTGQLTVCSTLKTVSALDRV